MRSIRKNIRATIISLGDIVLPTPIRLYDDSEYGVFEKINVVKLIAQGLGKDDIQISVEMDVKGDGVFVNYYNEHHKMNWSELVHYFLDGKKLYEYIIKTSSGDVSFTNLDLDKLVVLKNLHEHFNGSDKEL